MKVMLVNPNKVLTPVTPIGLAYIYSSIKQHHDVTILDLTFEDDTEYAMVNAIVRYKPDLIGISIRNIDNATYVSTEFYIPDIIRLVDLCRSTDGNIPIVLGGAGFSIMPLEIIQITGADYGIIGEGEYSFPSLLASIENRTSIMPIPGVVFRCEDGTYCATPRQATSLGFSSADRSLLDNKRYLTHGGMGNVQTRRGCDLTCSYCVYPMIEGKTYRVRKPEAVADEIAEMYNQYGIDYIHFCDSTFNLPSSHAVNISRELAKRGSKVMWSPYVMPHKSLGEEEIEAFLEGGCDGLHLGVDSLVDSMLQNLQKSFRVDDVERISQICHKLGMPFAFNLMFGSPGESDRTLNQTINMVHKLQPSAVFAMQGVRVYPNTRVHKIASRQKVILKDSLLEPTFYISPMLQANQMIDTLEERSKEFGNWFMPSTNNGVHSSEETMNAYKKGIRGPIWKIYDTVRLRN